ncbi:MAG: DNA-protecting protein DprA, partial [Acidobacteria bacterium]
AQLRRALALRPRAPAIADAELARAERHGCRLITRWDDDYPPALLDLPLPPPVLYCRGTLPSAPGIAIVGARKMDAYGERAAAHFGRRLAAKGLTVVSGFALGIDQAAHRGALDSAGGRTVAVLGCGLDVDYPRRSTDLAAAIAERGALLSEFAFGSLPLPWRFPVRNRVIAALAAGTLVVQAKARSGALNTAHHALELGRDVYAVPGRIFDDLAAGPNALIADGAIVARSARDVVDSLPLRRQMELFPGGDGAPRNAAAAAPAGAAPEPAATDEPLPPGLAGALLRALPAGEARTAEELAAAVEAPVDRVLGALLELELAGRLRRHPGPAYAR